MGFNKKILTIIALLTVSMLTWAATDRQLDAVTIINDGVVITLPTSAGVLVDEDGTQTLTNKDLTAGSNSFTIDLTSSVSGALPFANGGTGQTTQQAAIDALVPTQSAQSGKVLQTDGTNVSWQTPAAGGATVELDNLGTTALGGVALTGTGNVVPENNLSSSLGFNNKIWNVANIKQISIFDGSGVLVGEVAGQQQTIPTGGFVAGLHVRGEVVGTAHGDVFIYSEDDAFNDTDPTGDVLIASGNKTVGTAGSGDVTLFIGAATGTKGEIIFLDGSEGNDGYIWTQNGTGGAGNWEAAPMASPDIGGTRASPTAITTSGITAGSGFVQIQFVEGSGGPINITADPQITAGTNIGETMTLVGRNDTNTLTLDDGTGLSLNGVMVLSADSIITLLWDGTNWNETSRR